MKQACTNVGETAQVSIPTGVAAEFARLVVVESESALRTAGCVLCPSLEMALEMGSIDGPPNMVEDLRRGYALLAKAL